MSERFGEAKAVYEKHGVDVDAAIRKLGSVPISIHCWQGDDICGFEALGQSLSGGLQITGSYPGKAATPEELMGDLDKAFSLIPGKKRLNLHASYAIFQDGQFVDRDQLEPKHFERWVEYAKERNIGLDFNPTFFSHRLANDGLTLSHPDDKIRDFWVNHAIACRRIAAYFATELGEDSLCNVWVPDGYKNIPADRMGPRLRLKDSLDRVFNQKLAGVIDSVESKVFGIGLESFTVGSSEFYINYTANRKGVYNLIDNGHYHPQEMVSDKLSSFFAFFDKVPLHVTHPVRWDSDHVVLLDDELKEIAKEIVRCDGLDKVMIGLDFFDASINRIAAWVIGARNMQRALLFALLQPNDRMKSLQDAGNFTELMMLDEEIKTYPFGDIWQKYCQSQGVPVGSEWYAEVRDYEKAVLSKRG